MKNMEKWQFFILIFVISSGLKSELMVFPHISVVQNPSSQSILLLPSSAKVILDPNSLETRLVSDAELASLPATTTFLPIYPGQYYQPSSDGKTIYMLMLSETWKNNEQ